MIPNFIKKGIRWTTGPSMTIHEAAKEGNLKEVKANLKAGVNVNDFDEVR